MKVNNFVKTKTLSKFYHFFLCISEFKAISRKIFSFKIFSKQNSVLKLKTFTHGCIYFIVCMLQYKSKYVYKLVLFLLYMDTRESCALQC